MPRSTFLTVSPPRPSLPGSSRPGVFPPCSSPSCSSPSRLAYPALFAPWQALASDAAGVVALRLTLMPWLWLFVPREAERETNMMLSEKQAAAGETWLALWAAPWHFWSDATSAGASGSPVAMMERVMTRAGERLLSPSHGRVGANRRRLAVSPDER